MSIQTIILLKRPSKDDLYKSMLIDAGFKPVFLPVISHQTVEGELLQIVSDVDYMLKVPFIVVTSKRSADCINVVLNKVSSTQKETVLKKPVYAVGKVTAQCLQNLGFQDIRGEDAGNAKRLSKLILSQISTFHIMGPPLLLVGLKRTNTIPACLNRRGFTSREVVTYYTLNLPDTLNQFEKMRANDSIVVCFSTQGVADIVRNAHNESLRIVAIGPTTKDWLEKRGINNVSCDQPCPESLVYTLKNLSTGSIS